MTWHVGQASTALGEPQVAGAGLRPKTEKAKLQTYFAGKPRIKEPNGRKDTVWINHVKKTMQT